MVKKKMFELPIFGYHHSKNKIDIPFLEIPINVPISSLTIDNKRLFLFGSIIIAFKTFSETEDKDLSPKIYKL